MKNRKLVSFVIVLISLFMVFLFLYNKEFDYNYEYEIDEYKITESYIVEDGVFKFTINDEYEFFIDGEYSVNRGLIENLYIEDECLYLDGKLNFYTMCIEEDNYYFLNMTTENTLSNTFENFKVYDLVGFSYFLWDYDGFIYISNDKTEKIMIFENDVYSPNLIKQVGDYLFIPNYDDEYYFSSYYLVDMENASVKQIELDTEINFDITYLSSTDTTLNIYDKKNEKVYTIKLSNGNQETKHGITYSETELESYSNTNKYFSIENNYLKYELNTYSIFLKDYEIDDIIYEDINSVIFLEDDELFYYSLGVKFVKIMEYSEWEFNYNNLIFVY